VPQQLNSKVRLRGVVGVVTARHLPDRAGPALTLRYRDIFTPGTFPGSPDRELNFPQLLPSLYPSLHLCAFTSGTQLGSTTHASQRKENNMSAPTEFKLNNGVRIPAVGLGTWQAKPGEVQHAVSHALKSGYKHIDCALCYQVSSEHRQSCTCPTAC
jgi:hypothetical protein